MEKELPKNWTETKLNQVVTYKKGKKPKKLMETEFQDSVPYLDIKAFEKNEIRRYADIPSSNIIQENQIGIVWDGARSGWVTKGKHGAVGSTIAILNPIRINENYLLRFLESKFDFINTNTRGTGIPHVDPKILWGLNFPLPPRPEQDRIVAKLDKLFCQLEVINESLEKIPVLLKNFRQQVLTQAVTGKLTEEWRKGKEFSISIKQNITEDYFLHPIPASWVYSTIGDIGQVKGGKRLPKGEELVIENTGLPYIRARDLKKGTVLTKNLMFLRPETQKRIKRYTVREGDLYITIVGAKIGDAGLIPNKMDGANLTENAAKIAELEKGIVNKYFAIWLRSFICQNNIQQTIMSAAQGKLALTRIKQLPIYIPPSEEQNEILRISDGLLSKADTIEKQYKKLKEKITHLPQSILHKAFNGELVPQLESDGDARKLLEEIRNSTEKLVQNTSARKKSIKNFNKRFSQEYLKEQEGVNRAAESKSTYSNKK